MMKTRFSLLIVFVAGLLLLEACNQPAPAAAPNESLTPTPTSQPSLTAAPTSKPLTPTPTSQPSLTDEKTLTETLSGQWMDTETGQIVQAGDRDVPLPASCLLGSEHSLLYVNLVDGYCLRYPARFRVGDVYPPGIANLYGPPLDPHPLSPVMAAASLIVGEPIGDRTLSEAADLWLDRRQTQLPTRRIDGILGGEPAEIVEYQGELSGVRTIFALYEDRLYALSFYPVDERFPQAAPDVEELWQTVSDSFAFLPPETRAADTETTAPPQIAFFQATPADVEPGDLVTLIWEASGERATICPTVRSVLFTSEDCRHVPLSGETTFTIPLEAEESRFVDFRLTVEAGGVVSPVMWQESVAFKCHTTWFFSDEPQAGICPGEPVTSYAAAQQFQQGMIIWIEQLGRYIILDQVSIYTEDTRRLVYYVDDPLHIVRDTSAEVITPPVRLHAPEGEFGLIWRGDISNSPAYREVLGWALAPEFGYEAVWQCDNGLPSGNLQTCYLQGPDNGIIVFDPLGGWYLLGEQEKSQDDKTGS
jgi:hypothetical protein